MKFNRWSIPEVFLGALLAVAIFAVGATFSSSFSPTVKQQDQTQATKSTSGGTTQAVEKALDANERIADYTWWLVILTAIMAVATAGLWWIAVDTGRRQLRAYVFLDAHRDKDDPPILNFGGVSRFPLEIVNRGQTPAYDVRIWVRTEILAHPLQVALQSDPSPHLSFTPVALGPGAFVVTQATMRPIPPSLREAILADRSRLYVFGKLWYRDAFRREQITTFRGTLPISADGKFYGLESCPEGNSAT